MKKRRKIKVNDYIEFTNLDNNELLKVKVTNLYNYNTFKELIDNLDSSYLGYDKETLNELIYDIYSKEEENNYGVIGIEIKIIKGDE